MERVVRRIKNRRGTPRTAKPRPRCNLHGKYRYPSKAKARKAAREGSERGRKLYVYRCPACGDWHLTHSEQGSDR